MCRKKSSREYFLQTVSNDQLNTAAYLYSCQYLHKNTKVPTIIADMFWGDDNIRTILLWHCLNTIWYPMFFCALKRDASVAFCCRFVSIQLQQSIQKKQNPNVLFHGINWVILKLFGYLCGFCFQNISWDANTLTHTT